MNKILNNSDIQQRHAWKSRDGESFLMQGNHSELLQRTSDESVDCVWTDPPYFLSNGGTTCRAGRRTNVNKGKWDESKGLLLDHEFNLEWLKECFRILKPSGTIWVSGTHHVYLSVGMAMKQLGFRLLNDIIWEKPNPPPNLGCRCFTHSTEIILWAEKPGPKGKEKHTFNYHDMKHINQGKQMKNVWRLTAPSKLEKRHGRHPTQKPLALIERALLASTVPGDIVLDPFTGTATTGVAAIRCSRNFAGTEIDPSYVEIAVKRLREIDDQEIGY